MGNSIVVCDSDTEYVHAFAAYLMEQIPGITVSAFTSEEAFLKSDQTFQVGILNSDFLRVLEFGGRDLVEEKLYLCDENIATEYEHLPMVYKYQSMEIVEEMLKRMLRKDLDGWCGRRTDVKTNLIGIYSPISHELSLPFGLSLCQIMRERGSVLFLDIEELSIMNMLIHQKNEKSLMDLLYLVVQKNQSLLMSEYINSFMGIDYISPFANPEELNEISRDAWSGLMELILSAGYDSVVILFGRTVQGFRQMISMCSELIVLGKPGDYYSKSQKCFIDYAEQNFEGTRIESISLPMSAGNLVDGTYMMEELIQGNLGMFVRKMIQEGAVARELSYGLVRG